jgi:uncharacterized protein YijF (DUF1287 family)
MSGMSLWSARGRAALLFLAAIPLCAGMLAQTSPDASSHAPFLQRLVNAAIERTHHSVRYDPAYVRIPYPGGDVVTYDLGGNVPHIGIVVDRRGAGGHYMIEHNIGQGPRIEDVLFNWKITGHYRYYGPSK